MSENNFAPKPADQTREEIIVSELQRFYDCYRGLTFPGENIVVGLHSVRNVYDADIAFILEMDSVVSAFRVISAAFREGLEGYGVILTQKMIARNLFTDIVVPDTPKCLKADELKDSGTAEYDWMNVNGVRDFMLRPLLTRTNMKAFVGVCNIGRLFGDLSMLAFSSGFLTNEIRALSIMDKAAKITNRSAALEDNDVLVSLFGGFEICTRRGMLDFSGDASSKCGLLFVYLLFNSNRVVPVRELAEVLWPDQLFDNPYNMVKGVAFRLKKMLNPISDMNVLVAKRGTYMLNNNLNLLPDTRTFELIYQMLQKENLTTKEKQTLYKRAISCYKGNLLPNYEDELWLVGKINYYQIIYSTIVKDYLIFLDKIGQLEDFFSVVSQVVNIIRPDGDIYNLILTVLLRQNRIDIARSCYLKIERLLSPEQKRVFINIWNKIGIK